MLHVIDHTGPGGAQVVVKGILRSLAGEYSFGVAVLGERGQSSIDYERLGVPVHHLAIGGNRWLPPDLRRLLRIVMEGDYGTLHCHLFKSSVVGPLVARWAGRRAVVHDHTGLYADTAAAYFGSGPGGRLVAAAYLRAYAYALRSTDRVVVLTSRMREGYERHHSSIAARTLILPNAVDLERFRPRDGEPERAIVQELGLPSETKLVLMVGRMAPEKDWPTFLEVAEKVSRNRAEPVAFLAIGSGPEESRMRALARERRLQNLFFLGQREDVPALLRQADVYVLTSAYESFPLVLLEAMAARCPIVATRLGVTDLILTHEVTALLAEVKDSAILATHVRRLLADSALAKRLALGARETAAGQFSLPVFASRISEIYRQVLAP